MKKSSAHIMAMGLAMMGGDLFGEITDGDFTDRAIQKIKNNKRRGLSEHRVGVRTEPKIGRNDPCTCGSGRKYKKCCIE